LTGASQDFLCYVTDKWRYTVNQEDPLKLALDHSRALFIYHANQRITSLNYYFVAIAIFISGFGFVSASSLKPVDRAMVGLVLSISGVFLTRCFMRLDLRNIQLVDCNEKLLKYAEEQMANLTGCEDWRITAHSDIAESRQHRYGTIVPHIFYLYIFLNIVGGIVAIRPLASLLLGCP
jgi:hypothetical protein